VRYAAREKPVMVHGVPGIDHFCLQWAVLTSFIDIQEKIR
jgi:hypothetical protein